MVKTVNDSNFDKVINSSKEVTLLYFSASWCSPCRLFKPIIEEVSTDFKDDIDILKLDADEAKEAVNRYNITSVPTIILLKNKTIVGSEVGAMSKNTLTKFIRNYI